MIFSIFSSARTRRSNAVTGFRLALEAAISGLRENIAWYLIIYAAALYASLPLLSSSSIPPGYDSVMHLSKIRIFSQSFPRLPCWFPWWYCGTPSLRFYPPLSYFLTVATSWGLRVSALGAYQLADFLSFYLAGLFMYHFMRVLTVDRLPSASSAILYMLCPQTLYGRFLVGHFTHNFSLFLIPLILLCTAKYGQDTKRTILILTPLFSLLYLTHLQTTVSLGFMLAIYIFLSLVARLWREDLGRTSITGLFSGSVLGAFLAGFWLLPALWEGSTRLGLSGEAALRASFPIGLFFVEADNPWHKQYFLGFPLISLALLAVVLIAKRKLDTRKTFWGIVFSSWLAFFLFAVVSPYIGLVLGWPNRFAYFTAMPMAMLAGLAMNWLKGCSSSLGNSGHHRGLVSYSLLIVVTLSVLIHTSNVEQFALRTYENDMEVIEWFAGLGPNPVERVASFGTFSYVFNVLSNSWQLDGGYVQGQINPDFYYKYWHILTTTDDTEVVLKTLNETNTRYVVFLQESEIPSAYRNQTFFDRYEIHGFTIFKLRDSYTLNFVEVTEGNASVNYSYSTPDELHLTVQNYSENATLIVKMNYYPGWETHSFPSEVNLTNDSDGRIKIEIHRSGRLDITLKYGLTSADHVALGTTIAGTSIYLFLVLRSFLRISAKRASRLREGLQLTRNSHYSIRTDVESHDFKWIRKELDQDLG
jgi:hypothetical protein